MTDYWLPSPRQIKANPQLASMAALQAILEMACFALHAAHPEAKSRTLPCTSDATWMARRICDKITALHIDIDWYRNYLSRETPQRRKSDDFQDLPF
jgi:hypothetical protein